VTDDELSEKLQVAKTRLALARRNMNKATEEVQEAERRVRDIQERFNARMAEEEGGAGGQEGESSVQSSSRHDPRWPR
jgi:hypothetical protein